MFDLKAPVRAAPSSKDKIKPAPHMSRADTDSVPGSVSGMWYHIKLFAMAGSTYG